MKVAHDIPRKCQLLGFAYYIAVVNVFNFSSQQRSNNNIVKLLLMQPDKHTLCHIIALNIYHSKSEVEIVATTLQNTARKSTHLITTQIT